MSWVLKFSYSNLSLENIWFEESGIESFENGFILFLLSSCMETNTWKPSKEEREFMEAVWMQVKGACEKLKEETNGKDEHILKMLQEMAYRYYQ